MSNNEPTHSFVHIGFNNVVRASAILAVMRPNSQCAKRHIKEARAAGTYLDMTAAHLTRSILLTDDGKVIGCGLNTRTIQRRLNGEDLTDDFEEEGPNGTD